MMVHIPLICLACNRRGGVAIEALASTEIRCICGSTDVDVDDPDLNRVAFSNDFPMGIINNDPYAPMDLLGDNNVAEVAKCSSCGHQWKNVATDATDTIPPCPNCGSVATSVAGGTNTGATASRRTAAKWLVKIRGREGFARQVEADTEEAAIAAADLTQEPNAYAERTGESISSRRTADGMWNAAQEFWNGPPLGAKCDFCGTPITQLSPNEWVDDLNNKASASPEWHEHNVSGPWVQGNEMLVSQTSHPWVQAKIATITQGILNTNPGMDRRQAVKLAQRTVARYPNVVRSAGIEEYGLHKATPNDGATFGESVCKHCNQRIKHLPAGQGWVHKDSGAVVGRDGTTSSRKTADDASIKAAYDDYVADMNASGQTAMSMQSWLQDWEVRRSNTPGGLIGDPDPYGSGYHDASPLPGGGYD